MSYNKIFPMFLFVFAVSIHTVATSKITSKVTNNTSKSFDVYWTAAGCAGVSGGVTELCKKVKLSPSHSETHTFSGLKTNLQVKISPKCVDATTESDKEYGMHHVNLYCPSGNWAYEKHDHKCALKGKGRGHVKNVVVNGFNWVPKAIVEGTCNEYL